MSQAGAGADCSGVRLRVSLACHTHGGCARVGGRCLAPLWARVPREGDPSVVPGVRMCPTMLRY
eukprot:scaffold10026_cov62-Phaeocystis_antarctica.AAC.12